MLTFRISKTGQKGSGQNLQPHRVNEGSPANGNGLTMVWFNNGLPELSEDL